MSCKVFNGMTWNGQPLLLKIQDMPDVMLSFCHNYAVEKEHCHQCGISLVSTSQCLRNCSATLAVSFWVRKLCKLALQDDLGAILLQNTQFYLFQNNY